MVNVSMFITSLIFHLAISNVNSSKYCRSVTYNGIPWFPIDVCMTGYHSNFGYYGSKFVCEENNRDYSLYHFDDALCQGTIIQNMTYIIDTMELMGTICDTNTTCDYAIGKNWYDSSCVGDSWDYHPIIINQCLDSDDIIQKHMSETNRYNNYTKSFQYMCSDKNDITLKAYNQPGCIGPENGWIDYNSDCDGYNGYGSAVDNLKFISCDSSMSNFVSCQFPDVSLITYEQEKIQCGDSISGMTTQPCDDNYYNFTIKHNDYVSVKFLYDYSDDIYWAFFTKDFQYVISQCNDCDNSTEILLDPGEYIIRIGKQQIWDYGEYNLNVQCSYYSATCDYFYGEETEIQQNRILTYSLPGSNYIQLSFEIMLYSSCNPGYMCNILHVGDNLMNGYPSVSINGSTGHFNIIFNNTVQEIINSKAILTDDGIYHSMRISINNYTMLVEYGGDFYSYNMSSMHSNQISKYTLYTLYTSNPWMISLNATIKNICMNTTAQDHVICCECGQPTDSPDCLVDFQCAYFICVEAEDNYPYCCTDQWDFTCAQKAINTCNLVHEYYVDNKKRFKDGECLFDIEYEIPSNGSFNLTDYYGMSFQIKDIVEIQFDIKLYESCVHQECNIIHFGNSVDISLPHISLTYDNNWIIYVSDNKKSQNVFHISDMDAILRNDDMFHTIKFMMTNDEISFQFDDFEFKTNNTKNQFYHSKYYNEEFIFYVSSPWSDQAINGKITDICIKSFDSQYNIENGTNYLLITTPELTWNEAEIFCETQFGTTLAMLQDAQRFQEAINLRSNLGENIEQSDFWIGLIDKYSTGDWVWYPNTSWSSNVDLPQNGNCGYLSINSSLSTIDCNNVYKPFICDKLNHYTSFPELLYTTSRSNESCDYFNQNQFEINNATIFNKIFYEDSIVISFDLKLDSRCSEEMYSCLIVFIADLFGLVTGLETGYFLFGLFIYAEDNLLSFAIADLDETDQYYAREEYVNYQVDLLDGQYHRIDFMSNSQQEVFRIDNQTYFMKWGDFSHVIAHAALVGIPMFTGSGINGTIRNICINTGQIKMPFNLSIPEPICKWSSKSCNNSEIPTKLNELEFDNVSDQYEIGWTSIINCTEGKNSSFDFYKQFTLDQIRNLLPYVMSVKITPQSSTNYDKYDDFIVETIPCSDPIFSINHGKELSFSIHEFNKTINYQTSNNNYWTGTDKAKSRLSNGKHCWEYVSIGHYSRDFPVIYSSCENGIRIDVNAGLCQWNHGIGNDEMSGENIEIHFGFDKNKKIKCEYTINTINIAYSTDYIMVPYTLNGFDAELFCEQYFVSSLALGPTTSQQVKETLQLRVSLGFDTYANLWNSLVKPYGYDYKDYNWYWYENENNTNETQCWDLLKDNSAPAKRIQEIQEEEGSWMYQQYLEYIYDPQPKCGLSVGAYIDADNCTQEHMFLCNTNELVIDSDYDCDYYFAEVVSSKGLVMSKNIQIGADNYLSFEMKLENSECSEKSCNILNIFNDSSVPLISIFMKGENMEIIIFDVQPKHAQPTIITNAKTLLRDGIYHLIEISFNYRERIYSIDQIRYFIEQSFYDFQKQRLRTHTLYVSDPLYPSANAMIRDICIDTLNVTDGYLPKQWINLQPYTCTGDSFTENRWCSLSDLGQGLAWSELMTIGPAAVGFWNKQLVLIDGETIYYKQIHPVQSYPIIKQSNLLTAQAITMDQNLNVKLLNNSEANIPIENILSQQSVQIENILYVLKNESLAVYDLQSLTFKNKTIIPLQYRNISSDVFRYSDITCVTTDNLRLYFINSGIVTYDMQTGDFNRSTITTDNFNLAGVGCTINVEQNKIYIFGGMVLSSWNQFNLTSWNQIEFSDAVYEYNIEQDSIRKLQSITLDIPSCYLRAMCDGTNMMYLYGGVTSADNLDDTYGIPSSLFGGIDNLDDYKLSRQIFDANNNQFLPIQTMFEGSHWATMAVYDAQSNLLIRYSWPEIFYLPLQPTAIQFDIKSQQWRTHVVINYILNDYTQFTGLYKFMLQFTNTEKFIMLNQHDSFCYICNQYEWSTDCMESCFINVDDKYIDSIDMKLTAVDPYIDILRNNMFVIEFNKCKIDYQLQTLDQNFISVIAFPQDTQFCSENTDPSLTNGYITLMENDKIGINNTIHVHVVIPNEQNATMDIICTICPTMDDSNCVDCLEGVKAIINSDILEQASFTIYLTAITTDLVINANMFTLEPDYRTKNESEISKSPLSTGAIIGIVVAALLLAAIVGYLIYYSRKRSKKIREEQLKIQIENETYIEKVMVIFIGISTYAKDAPKNAGIDIQCSDVGGIDVDYRNIHTFCQRFNYELYPSEPKVKWTKDEILTLLKTCAEKANNANYDGILTFVSCNGYGKGIITSDYYLMDKIALHRLLSMNFPKLREIPRLFCYDTCNINDQNIDDVDYYDDEENGNFGVEQAQFNEQVRPWARDHKNPDFKLITVDHITDNIKSKSSIMDGSYFIHQLLKALMQNNTEYIGVILDDIQVENRKYAKGQMSKVFNNHTEYVKLKQNDHNIDSTNANQSENDDNMTYDMIEMEELLDQIDVQANTT
eukprot:448818_1